MRLGECLNFRRCSRRTVLIRINEAHLPCRREGSPYGDTIGRSLSERLHGPVEPVVTRCYRDGSDCEPGMHNSEFQF